MPAICVLLDGVLLATVNTYGYDVVSVHVHGTRIDDDIATLEMSGGSYPKDAESTHLIWINSLELRPGQQIEVRFQETGETFPQGKTIDELFPGESTDGTSTDFRPTEGMFDELRAKPSHRDSVSLRLLSSTGTTFVGQTASSDHGFGFSLVWNSYHVNRAHNSLHAYTLDELESRKPMRDFVNEYVNVPYAVTLQVDA